MTNKTKLKKKTKTNEEFYSLVEEGVDVENRIIYLFETIDFNSVGKRARAIEAMILNDSEKPINIFIGSFGGSSYAGFWLYDFIRSKDIEINTYGCGAIMSAGSIVFMAGDKRYIYPHSKLMLHSISSWSSGKLFVDLKPETESCEQIYSDMCRLYAKYSCKNYNFWYNELKYTDKTFNSKEAINYKLADKIVEIF